LIAMPDVMDVHAAALKRDVAATLGERHARIVERHARRLLPLVGGGADALTAKLTEDVQQELHDTFVDTTWPYCPEHPHHPLWFDEGAWRCMGGGTFVAPLGELDAGLFADTLTGLRRGDFSRLAPLFDARGAAPARILDWHARGMFAGHPELLAEALSNACFVGATDIASHLTEAGVDVAAGTMTGLDGVHWAANRGQLDTVRMLLSRGAPLESINMHGTTVLGTAVWSAVNEPRLGHLAIIEALLEAGAAVGAAGYPSGDADVDSLLERYGASQ
jgi:hypothetical protein